MIKRIILCATFCVLAVGLQSCQRGCSEYDDDPQTNLQALWDIIDQHYCFLDYKADVLGLDWDEMRTRYSNRLNPQMTRAQLFEVLCNMLSELQDGHVNLFSSADMGRNWSWKEDYPSNWDYELRNSYLGTKYKIASGLKYRVLEDNVGYVLYESFTSAIGEGNLDDVLYYLRVCNGLIIDIRGNSGGYLSNVETLSSRFTNEKILVGYTSHKTGTAHSDFSTPEADYLKPSVNIRWQKPVVVLANRECYSSANTFVRNMKECPNVTVLGDKTGGGSGLPFTSELPIGWGVRFSACPSFDARMQQTEFGIEPDVYCALSKEDVARGFDTLIEEARKILAP